MLKGEFENLLPEGTRKPTEKEFEVVSLVYGYHPAISSYKGKEQIAKLYSEFGMRIIYDMRETARRMEEIEEEIYKLNERIADLEDEKKELAMR